MDEAANILALEKMKELFLAMPTSEKYKNEDYFTIFSTLMTADNRDAAGRIQAINTRNAIMVQNRRNTTLPHEMLHGLGLYHTHYDRDTEARFLFRYRTTTNIMSYSTFRLSLWHWQWHIINCEISEK